jgi:hypothetical protein
VIQLIATTEKPYTAGDKLIIAAAEAITSTKLGDKKKYN